MSYALLITAAFIGPQAEASADFWRDEYRAALAATADRVQAQPDMVVPRLVALYQHLDDAGAVPRFERSRMRHSLELRLVKQLELLLRERRRLEQVARRSSHAGGAAVLAAQQLINVIVTTIAPDSWRQNGGNGTISYYPINPALVVRQTGEVHEQVSLLLRAFGN